MADLAPWVLMAANHLREAGARYAVIGGLAVSIRAEPRFTRDVDFAISADSDSRAEEIVGSLSRRGYRTLAELARTDRDRLATMRLAPPLGRGPARSARPPIIDLIFASCGIEPETVDAAERLAIAPGTVVPVARTPHLIAMKLVSASRRRRKDEVDIQSLIEHAADSELDEARELTRLVTARGYHGGRDLLAKLEELIRDTKDDS